MRLSPADGRTDHLAFSLPDPVQDRHRAESLLSPFVKLLQWQRLR